MESISLIYAKIEASYFEQSNHASDGFDFLPAKTDDGAQRMEIKFTDIKVGSSRPALRTPGTGLSMRPSRSSMSG